MISKSIRNVSPEGKKYEYYLPVVNLENGNLWEVVNTVGKVFPLYSISKNVARSILRYAKEMNMGTMKATIRLIEEGKIKKRLRKRLR